MNWGGFDLNLLTVFDAIMQSATHLLRGHTGSLTRVIEREIHLMAFTSTEESGNARFVRTLFEQALNRQALRLTRSQDGDLRDLDRADVTTLTADDLLEAARAIGADPEPRGWRRWLG